MTVDIQINTNGGVTYIGENLEWSEACSEIVNQYIIEQLHNIIFHEDFQANLSDSVKEQLMKKEEKQ